jgi:menaquinone-dependent protoporphyrinogen oxidase
MNLLVVVASKHGATRGIADAIRDGLAAAGHAADRLEAEEVASLEGVDAVVLGSAVYAGHWMDAARRFVDRFEDPLSALPVWVFSSGPIGDPPRPDEEPVDVADIVERTGAIDHAVFAGALDKSKLGFGERAIAAAFRAPEGDFRDWDEIRAWAAGIADRLART